MFDNLVELPCYFRVRQSEVIRLWRHAFPEQAERDLEFFPIAHVGNVDGDTTWSRRQRRE